MTIFNDLYQASRDAIAAVTVTISDLRADAPRAISPQEGFTFDVTATNSGADATTLTDVVFHLSVSDATVCLLEVPADVTARSTRHSTGPTLTAGDLVSSMYLFPPDSLLYNGDADTIRGLRGLAVSIGRAEIEANVRAKPALEYLFPDGPSPDGARRVRVV